jgi:hypothetical protein
MVGRFVSKPAELPGRRAGSESGCVAVFRFHWDSRSGDSMTEVTILIIELLKKVIRMTFFFEFVEFFDIVRVMNRAGVRVVAVMIDPILPKVKT